MEASDVSPKRLLGLAGDGVVPDAADFSMLPIGDINNEPVAPVDLIPGEVENPAPPPFATIQDVAVIVPVRDESANLKHVLPRLPHALGEVVVVVANGDERSVEEARRHAPEARIIRDPGNGKGLALRMGVNAARKPYVILLDADGSMNPAEIHSFLPLIQDGADLVKGSRNLPGGGSTDFTPVRVLGNRFLASLVNFLFGTKYTDLCYGYIAAKRSVYEAIDLESNGFNVEAELLIKAHLHKFMVQEVPSLEDRRIHGKSHLNWFRDGSQILMTILSLFARHRLRRDDQ